MRAGSAYVSGGWEPCVVVAVLSGVNKLHSLQQQCGCWLAAGVVLLHPRLLLAGRGAAHPSSPALLVHVCVLCVSVSMRVSGQGR